jgi:very-short-patch-repair endonuclease/endogenous inhibitor of DNA gyrase (YacG/DUF329 family)
MDNAEATPLAAGESVEITRRRSGELEQPHAGCVDARPPASTKVVNTPHESLFHQALTRARLSFETQSHPAGDRWEADIELHQAPIIIEVTNSPGQTRNADRYRRKTEAFEAAGYRVYWFSNHQARTGPDGCVARVMTENGLTPEANPVALIRTNRIGHAGNLNPNWGGGPSTTACEQCGKPVTAHKRNGGQPARFCSSQCYGKWMHEHPETVNSRRIQRDWSDLAKLYAAGMSTYQLAEHYDCSRRAVQIAMRNLGIQPRRQGGPRIKGGFYQAGGLPGS